MNRPLRLLLVVALATAGLAATSATASAATTTAPSLSPAAPIIGDSLTFSGKVPGGISRPVRLQVWNGKSWVTRVSSRAATDGTYALTYVSTGRSFSTRVAISRKTVGRKVYPTTVTKTRRVTQRDDAVTLTLPTSVKAGRSFEVVGEVASATSGRTVRVERRTGSTWTSVATGTTTEGGALTASVTAGGVGTETYRLVLAAQSPRTSAVSTQRTVDVGVTEEVPRLDITTAGAAPILSKEEYVRGTMKLDPRDSDVPAFTAPTRLRVRGNSTAWAHMKLSYKVKLDASTPLAGFPKSKDWVLLANFYDRSMLRTSTAFEASQRIGLPWTPRMQHVEVWVNGTLQGLYQLGEGIEKDADRVALPEDGVLLEADFHEDSGPQFVTSRGLQVFLKDPDDEAAELTDRIATDFQAAEDALYGDDLADPGLGYRAHLDVDSFVDWYLLNELMKNVDSSFNGSVWMSWVDGRIAMSAPWDFDLSAGNRAQYENADPTGWYLRRNWWADGVTYWSAPSMMRGPEGHWINRLFEDPAFAQQVRDRWAEIAPGLRSLPAYVAAQAEVVERAAERNFLPVEEGGAGQWIGPTMIDGPDQAIHQGSWPAEVEALSSWLDRRITWMDGQLG